MCTYGLSVMGRRQSTHMNVQYNILTYTTMLHWTHRCVCNIYFTLLFLTIVMAVIQSFCKNERPLRIRGLNSLYINILNIIMDSSAPNQAKWSAVPYNRALSCLLLCSIQLLIYSYAKDLTHRSNTSDARSFA